MDWTRIVKINQAAANIRGEMHGAWHVDPWNWPELDFLAGAGQSLVVEHLAANHVGQGCAVDVPKENWGLRPALELDLLDRLAYQATVDALSVKLIGDLPDEVYGWRLHPGQPQRGAYSHNNRQWERYRGHLSLLTSINEVALASDIVSFFASIPIERVQSDIQDASPKSAATERLLSLLDGFSGQAGRSGLPQRSHASAVLANMYLRPLDDALIAMAHPALKLQAWDWPRGFARWMDDFWLFTGDAASARSAQVQIQTVLRELGLHMNNSKTKVLAGDELVEAALSVQHSAVDEALDMGSAKELHGLIDRLLLIPEVASRTSVRFAVSRMQKSGDRYRLNDLWQAAERMPHVADALAPLFAECYQEAGLQDWLTAHSKSPWAAFEWSTANYLRMIPSSSRPKKSVVEYVTAQVLNPQTSLPLKAWSAQRLAAWDAGSARTYISEAIRSESNPQKRRALALAGMAAGTRRATLQTWLGGTAETRPLLLAMEQSKFKVPACRD